MDWTSRFDVPLLLPDGHGRRMLPRASRGTRNRSDTESATRRLVPQQTAQICWPSAGQPRRARLLSHRGQTTVGSIV